MSTERSWRARLAALAVLAALALTVAVVVRIVSAEHGRRFTATFNRTGAGFRTGSPVKMRGVAVGKVLSAKLDDHGRAQVTLLVRDGVKVPDSVTAVVETLSLYGIKDLSLVPGEHEHTGPYLADGARITRTTDPQDVGDLLRQGYEAFKGIDPGELTNLLSSLVQGYQGNGPKIGRIIDNMSVLMDLAERNLGNARAFLRDTADISETLAVRADAIADTVTDTGDALAPVLARTDQFGPTLRRVARLSGMTDAFMRHNGDGLGRLVTGSTDFTHAMYGQLGYVIPAGKHLARYLSLLNALFWVPTQEGNLLPAAKIYIPTRGCELVADLCTLRQWKEWRQKYGG